ncbi:hypothetical protein [Marinobacter changyiensis]|uniref:hypothetical protein n=1 Tax=Marinobacter changyiensis TaxID=2604091 RepID=UPI001264C18B|nr:hypothetical protein [Marinobacter changyiensis]
MAKKSDRESALGRFVLSGIERRKLPSLLECEELSLSLNPAQPVVAVPACTRRLPGSIARRRLP